MSEKRSCLLIVIVAVLVFFLIVLFMIMDLPTAIYVAIW